MSPREAYGLLDQVVARLQGTREDHINLQVALAVVFRLVQEAEAKSPKVEGGTESVGVEDEESAGNPADSTAE